MTPRFTGLLIVGVLLALVGSSILVSITFQSIFVPAPLLVRGGSVYAIPLVGGTGAPWRSYPAGMRIQLLTSNTDSSSAYKIAARRVPGCCIA